MTLKQKEKYNRMLATLRMIAREYKTPEKIRFTYNENIHYDYEKALETAYENIQQAAEDCIQGIRKIK